VNRRRTLIVFLVILALYVVALLPALVLGPDADTPLVRLAAAPYLSANLFHSIGVPGLLQHGGACGWGWCEPTWFGWLFVACAWLGLAWVLAWLVSWMLGKRQRSAVAGTAARAQAE